MEMYSGEEAEEDDDVLLYDNKQYSGSVVDENSDASTLSEQQGLAAATTTHLTSAMAAMRLDKHEETYEERYRRQKRQREPYERQERKKRNAIFVPPGKTPEELQAPLFACSFCGHRAKKEEMKKCPTCVGHYVCNRTCQMGDWEEASHKLVCGAAMHRLVLAATKKE